MKAIVRKKYGGPEVIQVLEVDKPIPGPKEVLIKVHATTVNRTDCGTLTGKPFVFRFFIGLFSPTHEILGTDFAGEVVGVGKEVSKFEIGDRVWGLDDEGLRSQAEYMVLKEDVAILKIPGDIDYDYAAASAEGAHYAFNFVNKLKLKSGDRVLVNGATGAIGSALIQILKYYNCYVTAVVNTKNMDLIRSYGVDKLYDYETQDFTQDDEKYNFICDAVGKSNFNACKPLLMDGGIYVSSELGPGNENTYLPLLTMFNNKKVKFPIPSNRRRSLMFIDRLIKEEKFKPVIDTHYNMSDAAKAYAFVMTGQKTGNVILKIN